MEQILSNIIFVPLLIAVVLGISRPSLRWIRLGAALSSLIVMVTVKLAGTILGSSSPPELQDKTRKRLISSKDVGVRFLEIKQKVLFRVFIARFLVTPNNTK